MSSAIVELERQLIVDKDQLRRSLKRLGDRASDAVDWRRHVRQRPAKTLGVALLVGVVLGALTSRPAARRPSATVGDAMGGRSRVGGSRAERPEWSRLKAGLMGLLADRAVVVARDFVDRIVPSGRRTRSSRAGAEGSIPGRSR